MNIAQTTVENIVDFAKKGESTNEVCFRVGKAEDCKSGKCF
jgi:hypothetical protein